MRLFELLVRTGDWLVLSSCQGNNTAWQAWSEFLMATAHIEARCQTAEVDLEMHPSNVAQPGRTLLYCHASHVDGIWSLSLPSWGLAVQNHEM